MPNDSAVALIAPYVAHDLARAQSQGEARPALARMAGRGELQLLPGFEDLEAWRVGLLSMLGLENAATRFPEGAVTAAADLDVREGCWLMATPLNFAAGMSNLAASELAGAHAVSAEERLQLGETLAAHLHSAGFQLEEMGGQWVVRAPETLNAVTRRPELAVRDLDSAMPTGLDAPVLRRLMAELQMLLHGHAVNQRRARRGAPEVNAIWLHGIGGVTRARRGEPPQAFGDEPYLRGLYKLHNRPVQPPLGSAGELLARKPDRALVLVEASTLEALETRWVEPLVRAVRAGRIASLDVVLARWRIRLDRAASWKFWRRPLPLEGWPQ
jgi:hypothetical protein